MDNNGGMAEFDGKGISKKTENAILFLAGAEKDARVPDNWMTLQPDIRLHTPCQLLQK